MGTQEHSRRTVVRDCDDLVDDDSVYAGIVVWLGRPQLRPEELARWNPPSPATPATAGPVRDRGTVQDRPSTR